MATMEEQARLSGLSFYSETPQWSSADWPLLLGGWRCFHASVVLEGDEEHDDHHHHDRDGATRTTRTRRTSAAAADDQKQSVVLLGGYGQNGFTSSVIILDVPKMEGEDLNNTKTKKRPPKKKSLSWRKGPSMNSKRSAHAASSCLGGVYVLGGHNESAILDTIERIDITLLQSRFVRITSMMSRSSSKSPSSSLSSSPWKQLKCRLSSPRRRCAAVTLQNRYIVVVGGETQDRASMKAVDIIDAANQTLLAGFSRMDYQDRIWLGASTVNLLRRSDHVTTSQHGIVLVGGQDKRGQLLDSVEFFRFDNDNDNNDNPANSSPVSPTLDATPLFKKIYSTALTLTDARKEHGITTVVVSSIDPSGASGERSKSNDHDHKHSFGSSPCCVIVAGGKGNGTTCLTSVEVMDTNRHVVWSLPEMTVPRRGCTMVTLWNGILVLGGFRVDSVEFLPLKSTRERLKNIAGSVPVPTDGNKRFLGESFRDSQRPSRFSAMSTTINPFYSKLVETHNGHISFKLHDLAKLVSNVHQMKLFYTLLNNLYRTNRISGERRQRFTLRALQKVASSKNAGDYCNSSSSSSEEQSIILQRILHKCRQDGVVVDEVATSWCAKNNCKNAADGYGDSQQLSPSSSSSSLDFVTDIRHELAQMEFRVGKVNLLGGGSTANVSSSFISDVTREQRRQQHILSRVKLLAWSLKQLGSAFYDERDNEVASAAICSMLNACCIGYEDNIMRPQQKEHSVSTETPKALSQIVDYGDVAHITSVVTKTGSAALQRACEEGIAMVERATAANTLLEDNAKKTYNASQLLGDIRRPPDANNILVTIMGRLATAIKRWGADSEATEDGGVENGEAATILALVVTAKMVQASECSRSSEDSSCIKETAGAGQGNCCDSTDWENDAPENHHHEEPSSFKQSAVGSILALQQPQPQPPPMSMALRLQRMEAMVGVAQRVSYLENYFGLQPATEGMKLPQRVSRLEEFLEQK